jgi:hypothetical protein
MPLKKPHTDERYAASHSIFGLISLTLKQVLRYAKCSFQYIEENNRKDSACW